MSWLSCFIREIGCPSFVNASLDLPFLHSGCRLWVSHFEACLNHFTNARSIVEFEKSFSESNKKVNSFPQETFSFCWDFRLVSVSFKCLILLLGPVFMILRTYLGCCWRCLATTVRVICFKMFKLIGLLKNVWGYYTIWTTSYSTPLCSSSTFFSDLL